MSKLTRLQADAMHYYGDYVGQTIDVMTGYLTNNMNQDFARNAVGPVVSASTLRGLASKGFIRIDVGMWKGATITVLKSAEEA